MTNQEPSKQKCTEVSVRRKAKRLFEISDKLLSSSQDDLDPHLMKLAHEYAALLFENDGLYHPTGAVFSAMWNAYNDRDIAKAISRATSTLRLLGVPDKRI